MAPKLACSSGRAKVERTATRSVSLADRVKGISILGKVRRNGKGSRSRYAVEGGKPEATSERAEFEKTSEYEL